MSKRLDKVEELYIDEEFKQLAINLKTLRVSDQYQNDKVSNKKVKKDDIGVLMKIILNMDSKAVSYSETELFAVGSLRTILSYSDESENLKSFFYEKGYYDQFLALILFSGDFKIKVSLNK